jgi:hypothetical protein
VSRAPEVIREPHVAFALRSVETFERQDDALLRLQPLENSSDETIDWDADDPTEV